jgi:preprotein translocase subunit SecG
VTHPEIPRSSARGDLPVHLLSIASVLMIVLVLLHKGKGGGLSTMFGGGVSSSLGGSAVWRRNLDRMTVVCGLVWAVCIVRPGPAAQGHRRRSRLTRRP